MYSSKNVAVLTVKNFFLQAWCVCIDTWSVIHSELALNATHFYCLLLRNWQIWQSTSKQTHTINTRFQLCELLFHGNTYCTTPVTRAAFETFLPKLIPTHRPWSAALIIGCMTNLHAFFAIYVSAWLTFFTCLWSPSCSARPFRFIHP